MQIKDINEFIKNALKEDLGSGDHTSLASINKNNSILSYSDTFF